MILICKRCNVEKDESEFSKNVRGGAKRNFRHTWCNPCKAEYNRQAYANKPERREYHQQRSREQVMLGYFKEHYSNNPEWYAERDAAKKERYQTDPEYRARHAGYVKTYRDKMPQEQKDEINRKRREKYANDKEYRERQRANARAQYQRKIAPDSESKAKEVA